MKIKWNFKTQCTSNRIERKKKQNKIATNWNFLFACCICIKYLLFFNVLFIKLDFYIMKNFLSPTGTVPDMQQEEFILRFFLYLVKNYYYRFWFFATYPSLNRFLLYFEAVMRNCSEMNGNRSEWNSLKWLQVTNGEFSDLFLNIHLNQSLYPEKIRQKCRRNLKISKLKIIGPTSISAFQNFPVEWSNRHRTTEKI